MFSRYVVSQVKHNSYFLVGLAIGLWISLAVVPLDEEPEACVPRVSSTPLVDEYEPHREEKPLGSAGQTAGRSIQRPRYYSTELGMRGSLFTGILSSEDALKYQVTSINRTAALLQPSLKFFITANAMSSIPGLANVVGFTDTREMLKPFHALKYLADNFLEEYDFFFLATDKAFVNARRLTELVSKLSVSMDVYMGEVAEDDSHYCSLDSGILLSNSVLRAVHGELDWCVRNSYSAQHHENIGGCVLHAAHLHCTTELQGQKFKSLRHNEESFASILPTLADAVTVWPVTHPPLMYQLHAYLSRIYLEQDREERLRLRGYLWRNSMRHAAGYRNATWPGGLRHDPGLAPPLPDNRFDHLRWTSFNRTHVFMPDDHRVVAQLDGPYKQALDLVLREVVAWGGREWEGATVALRAGSWRWEPAVALRYRLLVELTRDVTGRSQLRLVEAVRALGGARLVPVRYVTESARVTLVVPVPPHSAEDSFLKHYESVCLGHDKNTALIVVFVSSSNSSGPHPIHESVSRLSARHPDADIKVLETQGSAPDGSLEAAALTAALPRVGRDALLLLLPTHVEFNQDFLNRVRMNCIPGEQWYLIGGFSRYSQFAHPGFSSRANTGRFNLRHLDSFAVYRADYDSALSEWRGSVSSPPAAVLAGAALRCVRAPEPGLVRAPRPHPCTPRAPRTPHTAHTAACLRALSDQQFGALDLGARITLAQLLLETEADAAKN